MPAPNIHVQLQLTGDSTSKRLVIREVASGITMLEVSMDPEAFMELMSTAITGSVDGIPAWVAPGLERIGKHVGRATIGLKTTWSGAPSDRDRDQLLNSWAGMAMKRVHAYSYRVSQHNNNATTVIFQAWHDTPEAAEAWSQEAGFILAELRGTAPGSNPA
jgi:hypothetical protein